MTFRQKLEDLLGLDIKMLMDKTDPYMQFMTKRNSYSLALKKKGGGLTGLGLSPVRPSVRPSVITSVIVLSPLYILKTI